MKRTVQECPVVLELPEQTEHKEVHSETATGRKSGQLINRCLLSPGLTKLQDAVYTYVSKVYRNWLLSIFMK